MNTLQAIELVVNVLAIVLFLMVANNVSRIASEIKRIGNRQDELIRLLRQLISE